MAVGLKAPNIKIDFKPSPKQYELWKLLQPDYCPHCGGHISQKMVGHDIKGNPQYKPYCTSCGSENLPQLIQEVVQPEVENLIQEAAGLLVAV